MTAHTRSKSFRRDGAVLAIGAIAGCSGAFVDVLEIDAPVLPAAMFSKLVVTNLSSPNRAKEYRKGMIDYGEISIKGSSLTAAGQTAMAAAFADPVNPYQFTLTMPLQEGQVAQGDVCSFNALVMGWSPVSTIQATKTVEFEAKLQITGAVTKTEGN